MKKKVISLFLAMTMVAGLTACQKDGADRKSTDTEARQNTEARVEAGTQADEGAQSDTGTSDQNPDDAADLVEKTGTIVGEFGYRKEGYSTLSFKLDGKSLEDCGDYYEINATLSKAVMAPTSLKKGDVFTYSSNELTGEISKLTYQGDGKFKDEDGVDYSLVSTTSGESELTYDSDDRLETPFYEGRIRIRKDAKTGAAVTNSFETVTKEVLSSDDGLWYNGVQFDGKGYVTSLVIFGD